MNPREAKYHRQGFLHGREHRGSGFDVAYLARGIASMLKTSEEEAVRLCLEDYRSRLDAAPSLAEYPELRGMRACIEAYNRGVAEGMSAPLEHVELRANFLSFMTNLHRLTGTAADRSERPGCTLVYFPDSDRGPLLANNQDGTATARHTQPPDWIVGNRAGLAAGTVSSGIFDDEVSPQRFPAPVFLMTYELCSTTDEATDLLARLNLFWGPCNVLVADRAGRSAVIEKSTCRFGLRPGSDGFAATTEMSAEDPAFKAYLWETRRQSLTTRGLDETSVDWAYWKAAERRSARLLQLTHDAKADPTFERMEAIIYDHTGTPDQVHMDGSKCHPEQVDSEWSLRTTVWLLNEKKAQYSFADPPLDSRLTPRHWRSFDNVELVF